MGQDPRGTHTRPFLCDVIPTYLAADFGNGAGSAGPPLTV